ncbi:DUF5995 family protein [Aquimarina mytili]|uniref:Uncharacterized protein n=1 Tax=Aquimarina mytili TaxID=874423 RepID=A0A936ZVC4_9FLAO|nr:DUF5995 family protein [Aquimarina mytili]MBL0682881.1 hypothetical protein [Aquimarina mytili]
MQSDTNLESLVINPVSIDQAIKKLESIIQWSIDHSNRVGYFTSLYLRVTQTVKSKIGTGYFDNDERLEKLDVQFAARYFKVVEQFQNNDPGLPKAWAIAFNAIHNDELLIVQHLLLAMNPHINIDLGAAAAEIAPGDAIHDLHDDFQKVNTILSSIMPTVLDELSALSPLLHLLEDITEQKEEAIINFSMKVARDFAWKLAVELAPLSEPDKQVIIEHKNIGIAKLGEKIIEPGFMAESILKIIKAVEIKNVDQIIDTLNAGNELYELTEQHDVILSPEALQKAPNQIYYFQTAMGTWTGDFNFKIKSWSKMFGASISWKNKMLLTMMGLFQKIIGNATIKSIITTFPNQGKAGVAKNDFRIHRGWFTLFVSKEDYILSPNGKGVAVDAHVRFGPFSFFFKEHDVYPAVIYENGFKALYHIDLLGTKFIGDYTVRADQKQVYSVLENDWAKAEETLNKQ